MEKRITTVAGDIDPDALGFTSMHDHTFVDLSVAGDFMKNIFRGIPEQMLQFTPENYGFLKTGTYLMCPELQKNDDIDFLCKEFSYFKRLGGMSVVDPSPMGARGTGEQLKALSSKTGLKIVCATGIYTATSRPVDFKDKDEEQLYQIFKNEIQNGIDSSGVRPGILKCAVATYDQHGIAQKEIDGIRACSRLSAETGLAVYLHTDPAIKSDDLIKTVQMMIHECGAEPEKIEVCHMDNRLACGTAVKDYMTRLDISRNISLDIHKSLLDMGVNIGLDTWGMPIVNPQFFFADDFDRVKALINLVKMGYTAQLTLGNDFSSKIMGRTYGAYGCTRFIECGLSSLKQYGLEEAIPALTIENPKRILSY